MEVHKIICEGNDQYCSEVKEVDLTGIRFAHLARIVPLVISNNKAWRIIGHVMQVIRE